MALLPSERIRRSFLYRELESAGAEFEELNGAAAAAHADNSDINILRWLASVERATLVRTARIWTRSADFEPFFVDAGLATDVHLMLEPYRKPAA